MLTLPSRIANMPTSRNIVQPSTDGTLASWLCKINPKYAPLVACLQQLPIHDPVAAIWRRYVDRPRAWLYERESGQGGFVGGMSVMLVFPRISKVVGQWTEGHGNWPDYVSALGVPLLAEGVTSPTIHYLDFKKSPPNCTQDLDRPELLMSRPSWIPAWTMYPASGLSRGWHSIDLRPHNRTPTLMSWMMQLAAAPRTQFITEMVSMSPKLQSLACTDWEDFSSWL